MQHAHAAVRVYSSCIFCNTSLGTNESIERFTVGRRLAFDAATGRLWVICAKCQRWNLSPLETRWEAIEEAERLFRGTKLRVSTDNIGLAQLRDGTELVRIGKPVRSEFAAWRYGNQFMRRWRKRILGTAAIAMTPKVHFFSLGLSLANRFFIHSTSPLIGNVAMVSSGVILTGTISGMWRLMRDSRPSIMFRSADGLLIRTSIKWMDRSAVHVPHDNGDWTLALMHLQPSPVTTPPGPQHLLRSAGPREMTMTAFTGEDALRGLSTLLPHLNRDGGQARDVRRAVDIIDASPDVASIARSAPRPGESANPFSNPLKRQPILANIPVPVRLALEMSLHENDERRALDGELKELEQRWKDADEIARIADHMFLPVAQ